MQNSLRCTALSQKHPCQRLQNRGSNFTLPQFLPSEAPVIENNVLNGLAIFASLRGGPYPDARVDVFQHFLCMVVAPPCDPKSNGLPLLFCKRDCEVYTMLKVEGACDDLLQLARDFVLDSEQDQLIQFVSIVENFDCYNATTYQFFESENYAETCTGLISNKGRGS